MAMNKWNSDYHDYHDLHDLIERGLTGLNR